MKKVQTENKDPSIVEARFAAAQTMRQSNQYKVIDVATNRGARKYTKGVLVARILWGLCYPLFRFSPRPFWIWRRMLLNAFGARVGHRAHVYPTVQIAMPWNLTVDDEAAIGDRVIVYALGPIYIGARSTISQGSHLCAGTHDIADPARRLLTPPIVIESDVWICADAFVGPGVTIGTGAIVGARAVVVKNVAHSTIVAGNPAKKIREL
jgi:putative colanic acid biosynthesis acetyltransferase WcaF